MMVDPSQHVNPRMHCMVFTETSSGRPKQLSQSERIVVVLLVLIFISHYQMLSNKLSFDTPNHHMLELHMYQICNTHVTLVIWQQ